MVTRFVPVGYQPEHGSESMRRQGPPRGRRPRRPDGRLRVPLPLRAQPPTTSTRSARRSTATGSTAWPAGCTSIRATARAGSPRPTTRVRDEALQGHARRLRVRRRDRRALHHLAGDRGLQLPLPDALRASRGRASSTASARPRPRWPGTAEALPRAQELRAGHEDLHAQHRDDAARHPQAARRGDRQHPGQHGLAAPAHERRAPAGVRRAAGRRGAARPPARQLGLGHLRRRQHGRRDGLHGDRRAGARAAPRRLRRQRRAAGLRPLPVHRGPGRRPSSARSSSGTSSTRSASASTATPCARRSSARTPSPPTSSSTPRWALPLAAYDAPAGARRRHLVGQGHRDRRATAPCWPSPSAATRCRPRAPAGASRTPRTGGAGRRRCSTSSTPPAPRASGSRARCTASSRSTTAGRPLRPAILWNDGRTQAQCDEIERAHRLRAPRRADRQPRARRLHRAQAAVAGRARARGLRAHRPHPAAQGLRPPQAHRRARHRRRRRLGHAALRRRRARLERRGGQGARRRPGVAAEGLRVARGHRRDPRRRAGRRRRGRPGRGRAGRRRGGRGRPGVGRARARAASSSPRWTATRTTPRRACTPSATPCRRRGTSWA